MGRKMKTGCLMLLDETKGVRARHQHRSEVARRVPLNSGRRMRPWDKAESPDYDPMNADLANSRSLRMIPSAISDLRQTRPQVGTTWLPQIPTCWPRKSVSIAKLKAAIEHKPIAGGHGIARSSNPKIVCACYS